MSKLAAAEEPDAFFDKLGREYWDRFTDTERRILMEVAEAGRPIVQLIDDVLDGPGTTKEDTAFRTLLAYALTHLQSVIKVALSKTGLTKEETQGRH